MFYDRNVTRCCYQKAILICIINSQEGFLFFNQISLIQVNDLIYKQNLGHTHT